MSKIPIEVLIEEDRRRRQERSKEPPAIQLPLPLPPLQQEPKKTDEDESNRGVVIIPM